MLHMGVLRLWGMKQMQEGVGLLREAHGIGGGVVRVSGRAAGIGGLAEGIRLAYEQQCIAQT